MVDDSRNSRSPESGSVVFASGDSGTSKDLIAIADEEDLSVEDYLFSYNTAATNNATVELYDDDEGTSAGSLSGQFESVEMEPGDIVDVSGVVRKNVTNDLVVVVDNNDDDLSVTVGAYKL